MRKILLRHSFKMVSCIKIETASIIFAILSLLATSLGSVAFSVFIVRLFMKMTQLLTEVQQKLNVEVNEEWLTNYALYLNTVMTLILSLLLIGLTFSIILTKGIILKKSHLVKGYFVYGVTVTVLTVLFGLYLTLLLSFKKGWLVILGCFLYSLILVMIKKTYLKFERIEHDKKLQRDDVAGKTISIKL